MTSLKENVRVVVRAKPVELTAPPLDDVTAASYFKLDTERGNVTRQGATVSGANELRHDFDGVFDDNNPQLSPLSPAAKQNVFFESHVRPLVDRAITQGLNLTIVAYGETASGKSWSLDGHTSGVGAAGTAAAAAAAFTPDARGAGAGTDSETDDGASTTGTTGAAAAAAMTGKTEEEDVEGIVSLSMRRCVRVLEPASATAAAAGADSAPVGAAKESGGGSNIVWLRLAVKFVEIYNEKLVDLLAAAVAPRRNDDGEKLLRLRLRRREDGEDVFFVENLLCFECDSVADAMQWYRRGAQQKTFRAHKMNAHSSRSHCIFTMIVTVCTRSADDGVSLTRRTFEMNFVDLAGSERPDRIAVDDTNVNMRQRAKAQAQAQALFSESLHINGSLSTLGRVITALSKGDKHAPFRESKLTCLLRHTLGSNGLLLFVACVSVNNVPETARTLVFASQARTIRVVARPVQDANTTLIQQLRARIRELESDLSDALAINAAAQQQQQQQQQHGGGRDVHLVSESTMEAVGGGEGDTSKPGSKRIGGDGAAGAASTPTNREALLSQSLFTACTKVQELIRANAGLRAQMDGVRREQDTVAERLSELERENLNLRERLDIMGSVVTLEAKSTQEALLRAAVHGHSNSSALIAATTTAPATTSARSSYPASAGIYSTLAATPKRSGSKKKKKTSAATPQQPQQQQHPQQKRAYDDHHGSEINKVILAAPPSSARTPQQQHTTTTTAASSSSSRRPGSSSSAPSAPAAAATPTEPVSAATRPTAFTVTTRQQQLPPLAVAPSAAAPASGGNNGSSDENVVPRFAAYMVASARTASKANNSSGSAAASPQSQSSVVGLPLSLYGNRDM